MLKSDANARVPREMTRLPRAGNPEGVKALEMAGVMLFCAVLAAALLAFVNYVWGAA